MRADVSHPSLGNESKESSATMTGDLLNLFRRLQEAPLALDRAATGSSADLKAKIDALTGTSPAQLFPNARCPEGALAGLMLFAGRWSSAHELVDDKESQDGCYWHALIHRIEPDTWNSDYWFRQVGNHPLYPKLLSIARRLASVHPDVHLRFDQEWNPSVFNAWCERTRTQPQSEKSRLIEAIHSAECHLLLGYSVEKARA